MATLEELERRQRQIAEQIRNKKRALAAQERKARNHALMVAGGLVMQHAPEGDWKRIDWDKLAAWIDRYGYKITECEAEALPTDEAYKRLKEWEHPKPKDTDAAQAGNGTVGVAQETPAPAQPSYGGDGYVGQ